DAETDWGAGKLNLWKAAERSPLINIGLSIVEDQFFGQNGLQRIINGDHDSKVAKLATFFNQFPTRVFYLRIGYEFDGQWNAYTPNKYVSAFQRIVSQMRPLLQYDNVDFVWQSCTSPIDDILDGGGEDISLYYPGDQYVDWMGMSWFLRSNEDPTLGTTIPLQQVVLANELLSFAQSKNKPVMICESAPQGYQIDALTNCNISPIYDGTAAGNCVNKTATEIYQEWFEPLIQFVATHPSVKAFSYINADWDSQIIWGPSSAYASGYWGDSRIEGDSIMMQFWRMAIADSSHHFLQTTDSTQILNAVSTVSIEPILRPEYELYPNPTRDKIRIEGSKPEYVYELFDLQGQLIKHAEDCLVDLGSLSKGIYLLRIDEYTQLVVKH
ncbi:MAG: T9SS type A sorting domain-containing protein, partial [Bacteroidota bacterium]